MDAFSLMRGGVFILYEYEYDELLRMHVNHVCRWMDGLNQAGCMDPWMDMY